MFDKIYNSFDPEKFDLEDFSNLIKSIFVVIDNISPRNMKNDYEYDHCIEAICEVLRSHKIKVDVLPGRCEK